MDKDERLRKIAALVHELRQPLNLISLTCGNIQKRNQSAPDDAHSSYLNTKVDKIHINIQKSSNILDEISFLTKE